MPYAICHRDRPAAFGLFRAILRESKNDNVGVLLSGFMLSHFKKVQTKFYHGTFVSKNAIVHTKRNT